MNKHAEPGDEYYADDLTWREQEVLLLLAERKTNREIAERLHLAESTVKDYVSKILSKLFVKNRREAVERAKSLGLLETDTQTTIQSFTNLPTEPTPFVGRLEELAEIQKQLTQKRLLTLTGPGGIGKTRLAIRTAIDIADEFENGCYFVSLAPIRSTEDLIQTIAESMNYPLATHEDPQQQLIRYLRKKEMLLVMDNFEHLLDGVGIISEILQATTAVKVLATSRENLNLQSETVFRVAGMNFPEPIDSKDDSYSDAVTLFVQSANKVRPGYKPTSYELEQIKKICQIVQGMPLAIELAAAWLHILNVDEICGELGKGFDILVSDGRDTPERHRSIETVFNHSLSMLSESEQDIFMRLSVFRGGFSRQAAQKVTGATLQQLAVLVNKSFLSYEPESGRLEIHELLRQYAQERLEDTPQKYVEAQEAQAAYFAEFMKDGWVQLKSKRQMQILVEIETDIENVRTGWRYLVQQKNSTQLWKYIKPLWQVYWIRGWYYAGMELFRQAASSLTDQANDEQAITVGALAMALQAHFMAWLDLSEEGYRIVNEGIKILKKFNHPEALALAYISVCVNAYFQGQYTDEIRASSNMLEIASELGDPWLMAFTLFAVSMGEILKKNYDEAERRAVENLEISEEIGDVIGSTMPMIVLGLVAISRDEYQQARDYYQRCLERSEQIGFYYGKQTASKYLGKVTLSLGEIAIAEQYILKCLKLTHEIGFSRDLVNLLYEYARLQYARGEPELAVELLGMVLEHPASQKTRMHEGSFSDSARDLLAEIAVELPTQVYTAALARGQKLVLDEVIEDLVNS